MKLAVFDFDSTLMDGETIDFLAEELGIGEQVTKITEEAMSGRLDFFESLTTRVALLKGMDYQRVVDICANLPLMPGAMELVPALQKMGYKVVCFSGGFRIGTTPAREKLGLDACPDMGNNALHASAGPLEGLAEIMLWRNRVLEQDVLGRALLDRANRRTVMSWLRNEQCFDADGGFFMFDRFENTDTQNMLGVMFPKLSTKQ
jgi:phosphoserine phosphatase SerB